MGGDVNLYAYVRNDPVRFVDPSGNALSIIAGIAGGALAGGAAGGLVGGISGFLTSVIEGQDLTQAIQSGIVSAGSGALAGAIVGGTVGGLAGGGFVIGVIVGQSANIGLPTVAGSIAGTIAGGIASVLGPPVSPAEGSRGSLGGQGLALELRLELVPQAKDIGGLSGGEKALRTQVTHNRGPGEPADLQKDTGAALRFPTSFGGLSKADLSAWLGLAISLFLGWIIVMPFVAAGPFAHPLVIGGTGVAFSAITTTLMMRAFRSKTDADESASIAVLSERATFAYPLVLRRLLRFGRIFWPLMLAVSVTGVLGGLGERSPMFVAEMIIFGFFFLLNLYVLARLVGEIRVSDHGLDVRMVSGRSIAIGWHEIGRLRLSRRRDRFRVETTTGDDFSVENSLPGYTRLLQLIEQRLEQRGGAG